MVGMGRMGINDGAVPGWLLAATAAVGEETAGEGGASAASRAAPSRKTCPTTTPRRSAASGAVKANREPPDGEINIFYITFFLYPIGQWTSFLADDGSPPPVPPWRPYRLSLAVRRPP